VSSAGFFDRHRSLYTFNSACSFHHRCKSLARRQTVGQDQLDFLALSIIAENYLLADRQ
jgi:hypothetical protein